MSIGFGIERLGHLTMRFPRLVAVAVVLITAFCLVQFQNVSVDGDILRVYRNSGEMYDRYQALRETFGTFESDAYILAKSDDLTNPAVLERLRELSFDIELTSYAAGTLSPFSLRSPTEDGGTTPAVPENMQSREEVAAALANLRDTDPMMGNLINGDLSGLVMIIFIDPELTRGDGEDKMLAELMDLIASYQSDNITVELTGPPVWKTEMLDATIADQFKFSVIGFLIGAVVSFICLRSFVGALLATLTPFISIIWLIGGITALFGQFTFLTNIVTTLVLVIAFAESMYFCFTWLRLWRDGMESNEAIRETVNRVTPAAALTSITTAVSFATLLVTQGQGIAEFGVSGVIGVAIAYVALVTFLPLAIKFAVRFGFKPPDRMSIAVSAPIPVARFLVNRFARPLTIAGIVLVVFMLVPHFLLQPRFDFQDFLPSNSEALQTAEGIDSGVGGVAPLYIRVPLKQGVENVGDEDFERIKKVHEIVESHVGKGKVISAASFTHYADSGFTREQIFSAVGPFLKRRFVTDDNKQAMVTAFIPTMMRSADLRAMVDATDAELRAAGIGDAQVSGLNVLTSYASTDIIGNLRNGLMIAIVVNLFVIGFAFRSVRIGLVAFIPNVLPILGTEVYLYFSGAGLQMTTVFALTIAFGIAVDDTIHFLANYVRQRKAGLGHDAAIDRVLERVGPALVATTLILCGGTFVVAFSALPQVALFGTLTVLTLVLALAGDLVFLPAMLKAGGRFFQNFGAKQEPRP
ncbi:MAG: MMPL family transporter [Alphaproteobacteria bacterium]|nr:MMPL family transporter [Alphaproteobacteria bacterium]